MSDPAEKLLLTNRSPAIVQREVNVPWPHEESPVDNRQLFLIFLY
jgi:hypothetical protein